MSIDETSEDETSPTTWSQDLKLTYTGQAGVIDFPPVKSVKWKRY